MTANEKIGPETRADDIKSDESDWKNMGKSDARLRLKELNDYPYHSNALLSTNFGCARCVTYKRTCATPAGTNLATKGTLVPTRSVL